MRGLGRAVALKSDERVCLRSNQLPLFGCRGPQRALRDSKTGARTLDVAKKAGCGGVVLRRVQLRVPFSFPCRG